MSSDHEIFLTWCAGESLLGGLAGDAEDRRYGGPWVAGLAGAGDGVAQCRRRLLAGVARGGDLEQCVRVGQPGGRGAFARGGAPLVTAGAQGDRPYRMVARTWQSGRSAA